MDETSSIFKKIDQHLAKYYKSLNRYDYFNSSGQGRFLEFVMEEELNEEDLDDELNDYENCAYLEFDPHFPFVTDNNMNEEQKRKQTYAVIKSIYMYIKYCIDIDNTTSRYILRIADDTKVEATNIVQQKQTIHNLDIDIPSSIVAHFNLPQITKIDQYIKLFCESNVYNHLCSSRMLQYQVVIAYWIRLSNIIQNIENGVIEFVLSYAKGAKNRKVIHFDIFDKILLAQFSSTQLDEITRNQQLFFKIFRYYWNKQNFAKTHNINNIHQISFQFHSYSLTLYSDNYYKYKEQYSHVLTNDVKCTAHSGIWEWNSDLWFGVNLSGFGYKYNMEGIDFNEFSKHNLRSFLTQKCRFKQFFPLCAYTLRSMKLYYD